MSLHYPTNIAQRAGLADILSKLMHMPLGPLTHLICDGRLTGCQIEDNEVKEVASSLVDCSSVYVMESTRGWLGPIAAFTANQALECAQLRHLIDHQPSGPDRKLPRRTADRLALYIRQMFADYEWLNTVSAVAADLGPIDGLYDLVVTEGEVSSVTLKDIGHRPWSARQLG